MKAEMLHEELGEGFFAKVKAADFNSLILRYRNQDAAQTISLDTLDDQEWCAYFGRFEPFPNSFKSPLALSYHGHQFGSYNPDIGDGRGFLYAQIREQGSNRLLDLGTKGSGKTPYSRNGDGRLTLKGAVREILASEYLQAVGVNSSKSLSVFETGEALHRHDEPSPARGAVLVRLSHSHIRIGSFQRLAYLNQHQDILKLAKFVIRNYYPQIEQQQPPEELFQQLLASFIQLVADMVAGWMAAGFVHGVLNTDNFNLTGESFDYGPWRFLEQMDFEFTAAYFDHNRRYAYGKQPEAALWALCRLADCFTEFVPLEKLEKELQKFYPTLQKLLFEKICWRFGIIASPKLHQDEFLSLFFSCTTKSQINLDYLFHTFYAGFDQTQIGAENEEILPFLKIIESQKARQNKRPDYFDQPLQSTLTIKEVEAVWEPISQADDWTLCYEKIQAIKNYRTALNAN